MKALTQSKKEDPRELKRDNFEIGGNDSKKSKKLDDTELNYDKNIKQETHKRVCVVDIYSKVFQPFFNCLVASTFFLLSCHKNLF